MSETTIAAPLSGEEIVEAMRHGVDVEVTKRLRRDCYLNPGLAYEGFDADVHIEMHMRDNGRIEVIEVRFHIEDRPPNAVREAAGLAIPTLIEDAAGKKDVKAVKYAGKTAETEPAETPEPPEKPPAPAPEPSPKEPKPSQIRR